MLRHLDLQTASGIPDARWEKFQIDELNNDAMFGLERKCRQVGWSFLIAMRGVADAILDKRSSVYNSINQREAQDKIRYARAIYENIRYYKDLPKIIIDNRQEIEFDNGARLISTAGGRGIPNSNFFIDEAAWKMNAREIYTGAVPVISKGGTFRMGSSTNGASGIFWEIDTESFQKYPDFVRTSTKWWEVEAFCTDVKRAVKEAPKMSTKERVEGFATERLKKIFANTVLEDFQQEYEAVYVDETTAWITWDEIKQNTHNDLVYEAVTCEKNIDEALITIERFGKLIQSGSIESVFGAGVDVGRTRNLTEIGLVGISTTQTYPLRLMISLDNVKYDDQLTVLKKLMQFGIVKMLIDRNGIGSNLAENMEDAYPSKAEGAQFALESKRLWATDVKMRMQQNKVPLPPEPELGYQIHSIKRKVTASANMVFDTEKNEKHHADKFWMLALALAAANQPVHEFTERSQQVLSLLK